MQKMIADDSISSIESFDTISRSDSLNSSNDSINPTNDTTTTPITFNDIVLVKVLNKAKFPVLLANVPGTNQFYAVKLFPFRNNKPDYCYYNEIQFSGLNHNNVISMVHFEAERPASFDDCAQTISYIIMELAPYGDFCDLMTSRKMEWNEKLTRTYFRQLIEGMEYLHSQGVAHLDLKLDNLLIGQNYTLKIADFDQAYVQGQSVILSKGTESFRAPEVFRGKCKNPYAADIYSAAIILFTLRCGGIIPYSESQKIQGVNFLALMTQRPDIFWDAHLKLQKKDSSFFSEDFKALFMGMVPFDPAQRLTIEQIKESNWYNGEIYSQEEVELIMTNNL